MANDVLIESAEAAVGSMITRSDAVSMTDSDLLYQAEQIEACGWNVNHSQNQLARALRELHAFRQGSAPAGNPAIYEGIRDWMVRDLATATATSLSMDDINALYVRLNPGVAAAMNAHADDKAVDRFAAVMKAKLAKKRADGRGGWQGDACTADRLSSMLREHVEKGDPVDVANFAMMLHQRGEQVTHTLRKEGLARFGNHPDPAIDFCIEVEKLESRLHQAEHGLSKPGTRPEAVAAVHADICRAMDFTVGGDEGAVNAKAVLRDLLARASRNSGHTLQGRMEALKYAEPLIAHEQVTHNDAVDKCIAALAPDAEETSAT